MSKFLKDALLPSAVILSVTLVLSTRTAAFETGTGRSLEQTVASSTRSARPLNAIAQSTQEISTPNQDAEVSELTDIKPTDSTAQSVPPTVERYGCVSGYNDRTYQGNQPVSRYEFAAALNACLNQVNQLINATTADRATQEDLAVPKRQLETLKLELDRLRMQVDELDGENKQQ
jgi:hypothetical protein